MRSTVRILAPAALLVALLAGVLAGCAGQGQTGSVTDGGTGSTRSNGAGPGEPAPGPTSLPTEVRVPTSTIDPSKAREVASSVARAAKSEAAARVEQLKRAAEKQVRADGRFTMPKLTGHTLQDAQDRLQARGSYLLDQVDATGRGRFQIDDTAWRVCAQKPASGARAEITTVVRLEVVRLAEKCP